MPFSRKRLVVLAAVALVLALAAVGAFFYLRKGAGPTFDPTFDTKVAQPAYGANAGPAVLYDEGHENTHAADGAYKPLADMLRSDGYRFDVTRKKITAKTLSGVGVLMVVTARGTNEANDGPAFTNGEAVAIEQWVKDGGSLLLVTDHWPYGSAAGTLASRFGVAMDTGLVQDPEHHDLTLGDSHLVFDQDSGLLKDHPIVRGRNDGERIHRVLTFTGTAMLGPPDAVPFLTLSDAAVELTPTGPRVERKHGDVRVSMDYRDPVWAKGKAQGIAFAAGKGRVVMLGEAGMLRAQKEASGTLVGMNVPGYDNRQLALNVMHWLSHVL